MRLAAKTRWSIVPSPAPHQSTRPRYPTRATLRPAAQADHKKLLGALQELGDDDGALAAWAADHREQLTLPFLAWLSGEELAAAADPHRQQRLWELGSKLVALREGLSPVGCEVLQAELRAAALRCSANSAGTGGSAAGVQAAAGAGGTHTRTQDVQQPAPLAAPAFDSAVQHVLSPEGMSLFQQQAAALQAVVGISRARSLTEVIGRAKVQKAQQLQGMADADAAVRILDVLLTVTPREDRAAMLPDAFTPLGSSAAVDDDAAYFLSDDDQVSTTPLRLLQAIDLYLARLHGSGRATQSRHGPALISGGLHLTSSQLKVVLQELREDVEAYALGGDEDAC